MIIKASTKSVFEIDILYSSKEPTTLLRFWWGTQSHSCLRRRWMEHNFPHSIWAPRVYIYAIRPHQCANGFPTHGKWYIPRSFGHLFDHLIGWPASLFKDTRIVILMLELNFVIYYLVLSLWNRDHVKTSVVISSLKHKITRFEIPSPWFIFLRNLHRPREEFVARFVLDLAKRDFDHGVRS